MTSTSPAYAGSGHRKRDDEPSARKRREIIKAATTLFLRNGYQDTSMDQVAALASVSKQTVYKRVSDKEQLFSDVVLSVMLRVDEFLNEVTTLLRDSVDPAHDLRVVARRYLDIVLQPQGLQLRRLIIAESGRFPHLARKYYQMGPERTLAALAACFGHLGERGLLRIPDPLLAAHHFAFLVLAIPLDKAMFHSDDEPFPAAERERVADEGVRVFLAAYSMA